MQLIKVPTSLGGLSSQKGAELAPDRVVAKLKEIWLSEAGQIPVFNISEVRIVPSNIAETARAIQQAASAHKQFAMIGGDHFITNPSFKGFATNFRNAGIVVFDAHADLMPTIPGAITHEDWLRELITAGALKPENVIIVGLRNVDKEERAFIQKMRIKNFSMHEITTEGIHEICDAVM
ncbi:MAG: arginase family protein, partial [Candidatus Woesearchaeota archaeon]